MIRLTVTIAVTLLCLVCVGGSELQKRVKRDKNPSYSCEGKVHGGYYVDPDDCSSYYICLHGDATPMTCEDGYQFNAVYVFCEPKSKVYCAYAYHTPSVSCDGRDEGTFLADLTDCQYFYRCMYGEARRGRCRDGHLWSKENSYCDTEERVDCSGKIPAPATALTNSPSSKSWVFTCEGKTRGGYYPDPNDCSRYHLCHFDTAISYQCLPDYYFNPIISNCDWIDNVYCVIRSTHVPTVSCGGLDEGTYLADPAHCQYFYRCIYGEVRRGRCKDGFLWSESHNSCKSGDNVVCNGRGTNTEDSESTHRIVFTCEGKLNGGFYADPNDCDRYHLCHHNTVISYQCFSGYYFNPIHANCDWQDNVYCVTGLTPVPPVSCDGLKDGTYLTDPTDCQYYYRCRYGEARRGRCQNKFMWNEDTEACDIASKVDCSRQGGGGTKSQMSSKDSVAPTTNGPSIAKPTTSGTMTVSPSGTTFMATASGSTTYGPTTSSVGSSGSSTSVDSATDTLPSGTKLHIMCYFTNWAQYRIGQGKYLPSDVDGSLCTDIIYAFAEIDTQPPGIKTREWNDNVLIADIIALKAKNPGLKVYVAIGGWSAGTAPFETITSTTSNIQMFADNAARFLRIHSFDGLDLDWEFPGVNFRSKFTQLCQGLHAHFTKEAQSSGKSRLLLSAAVSAYKIKVQESYEPDLIHQYLDHIAVMAYDFYGSWSTAMGHNSPLYVRSEDESDPTNSLLAQSVSMYWWHKLGVPKHKLIMGIASYGRSFKMSSSSQTKPGDPFVGEGDKGPYTATPGFLAYYEICELLSKSGWTRMWMDDSHVPYAYGLMNGHWEWVGYDDVQSIKEKAEFIKENEYGGAMFWTLDFDDFKHNLCDQGPYPLISNMKAGLQ